MSEKKRGEWDGGDPIERVGGIVELFNHNLAPEEDRDERSN